MFIKNLGVIACFLAGQSLYSQIPDLELTLRYNLAQTRFEVYARPNASLSNFNWGPSQITVLTPSSVPDDAFGVVSMAAGAWQDNSRVYAPSSAPDFDFHGVGSLGATTNLTANVEKLIFHFTLPGGGCIPGLRLYINGVDPTSSAPGMSGGDFSNTIFGIVPAVPEGYEAYTGNYENTGTVCVPLPLPLELTLFEAVSKAAAIDLVWHTDRETGFDHFELERSEDGFSFSVVQSVKGNGGAAHNRYYYTDGNVKPGIVYYYRLKMVDANFKYTYSGQISAIIKEKGVSIIKVAPNPTTGIFKVQLQVANESVIRFSLTDIAGRVIETRTVETLSGLYTSVFDVHIQPPGVYFLLIETKNERLIKRLLRAD